MESKTELYIYKLELNKKYQDPQKWGDDVKESFKRHAEFLHRSALSGKILIVGRTDDLPKRNFGLVIFGAEDKNSANQFANSDPIIQAGIMSVDVFPFKLFMVTDDAKKFNLW